MKFGLATICFNEERMIVPFLKHIPSWVEDVTVLCSTKPWQGEHDPPDKTAQLAKPYAKVIKNYWPNEHSQRNTGQDLHSDKDWVIIMDPDETFSKEGWQKLKEFLETTEAEAAVVQKQRVFWKNKEVSPCNDYQQLIAVRPWIKFVDKRIVPVNYVEAPVELFHFSWARTNQEVWSKISHYSHRDDFDIQSWYENVWLANKQTNLHPTTPEALGGLIDPVLPPEIKAMDLFVEPE